MTANSGKIASTFSMSSKECAIINVTIIWGGCKKGYEGTVMPQNRDCGEKEGDRTDGLHVRCDRTLGYRVYTQSLEFWFPFGRAWVSCGTYILGTHGTKARDKRACFDYVYQSFIQFCSICCGNIKTDMPFSPSNYTVVCITYTI